MNILDLVREDLRGFTGYASARKQAAAGEVWLNANESADAQDFDVQQLNRYPEPQPQALRQTMAGYYGVAADAMLVTRGSDEGIDLLVRALCRPGLDAVAIQSPTFGMYAVSARLHACQVIDTPLRQQDGRFDWDPAAMIETATRRACKLVFLCSPANPTGQSLPPSALRQLLDGLAGRCLLVVDEAYAEYDRQQSASTLLTQYPHLAVLKTLSKAHALAGARIGALLAAPELIPVLQACQAPYPIARPSAALALQALQPEALASTRLRVAHCLAERTRVAAALAELPAVRQVYRSDANFLLVRCADAGRMQQHLLQRGIVVRGMQQYAGIRDCLRVSIGSTAENDRLLQALRAQGLALHA